VDLGNRGSRARCLLVWSCATTAAIGAWRLTAPSVRAGASAIGQQRLDAMPLDRALADLAAALLLGCAAWLWLGTCCVVLDARPGRWAGRRTAPWVPSGLRRLVMAACGTAIVGALAQPAGDATADAARAQHRPSTIVRSPVTGLPLPERAALALPSGPPGGAGVLVAPGDTLWSIAARDLPPHSPDALIARRWRAIYAANRRRIGPDPDLIVPGLRLRLPGKDLP
jgi:nucleoid-associated protein YgaU